MNIHPKLFLSGALLFLLLSCKLEINRDEKLQIIGLSATKATTSIELSWDTIEHATAYSVKYKKADEVFYKIISESSLPVSLSAPSHGSGRSRITVNGLTPSTSYDFVIRALTDKNAYVNSDPAAISVEI